MTKTKKLPKGRVRYWHPSDTKLCRSYSAGANFGAFKLPCAVIPCRTQKEARAVVKLHAMPRDALAILIAAQIFHPLLDNRARDKSAVTHELAFVIMKALGL